MTFDWPGLMRLGLRGLGLAPETFWALTPAELMVMLGKDGAGAPLGRARLEELAQAFPDARRPDPAIRSDEE
ncbi:MAG: phage tail assembly chaperone [Maritimibacter sp.]|nr:phage tail assembly chaperone [Maritimibacter sp.]